MAWGLCGRNKSGWTSQRPRHCQTLVGWIGGNRGELLNPVSLLTDIEDLSLACFRSHLQTPESLQDSFKEKPWIQPMSLVRPRYVASYAATIIEQPILEEKRLQRGYNWSFSRQRSWNNLCIAGRNGSSLNTSCPNRGLGNKPSETFLKARILGRGFGLKQMSLELTWWLFEDSRQYTYPLEGLKREWERK